jgi:hypothetical protein
MVGLCATIAALSSSGEIAAAQGQTAAARDTAPAAGRTATARETAASAGLTAAAQRRSADASAPTTAPERPADSIAKYTLIRNRLQRELDRLGEDTTSEARGAALRASDSLAVVSTVLAGFRRQVRRGADWKEVTLTLAFLGLYFFALVAARWHHIARSLHVMINGQLAALSTRLETEVDGGNPRSRGIDKLQATVKRLTDDAEKLAKVRPFEFFFWSRGHENATWVGIHEVERQLTAFLAPAEHVDVFLRWANAELQSLQKPDATAIAAAIDHSFKFPAPDGDAVARATQSSTRKALLGRALSIIYADRDMRFSTLMEWQNKSSWLMLFALILIGFLTVAAGHSVLFLAGAAGGYTSRLMRALRREDVPLDYGASWTTLFLSPLFGALAGWFGVAIIALAANPPANLLGPAFQLVRWDDPSGPQTLAVAFLLGFSERFFDAVVKAVEKNVERDEAQQREASRAVTAAAAAQAAETSGNGKGAPAIAAPGTAVPEITGAELHRRDNGNGTDVLQVTGSGFATGATVKVNDEKRVIEVQSPQRFVLPLSEEDIKRIDAGADFDIVIANPGGGASKPYDFA